MEKVHMMVFIGGLCCVRIMEKSRVDWSGISLLTYANRCDSGQNRGRRCSIERTHVV